MFFLVTSRPIHRGRDVDSTGQTGVRCAQDVVVKSLDARVPHGCSWGSGGDKGAMGKEQFENLAA